MNAIQIYKGKGSAINGSIVRGKVEIDKRVLIYYIVYFRI